MNSKVYIFSLLALLSIFFSIGQDINYSQYYANLVQLNPAYSGAQLESRVVGASHVQWPKLGFNYISNAVTFDHSLKKLNSGLGLNLNNLYSESGNLRIDNFSLIYAYHLLLSAELKLSFGTSIGYQRIRLDPDDLTFGDQFNNNGLANLMTLEIIDQTSSSFLDIGSGAMLYNKEFWVGGAAHHLNAPSYALNDEAKIATRFDFHMGYKFYLNSFYEEEYTDKYHSKELSLSPTMAYRFQNTFDQFDIGVYLKYGHLQLGTWYRGTPIRSKKLSSSLNQAIVFLAGYSSKKIRLGYSYDLDLKLPQYNTGGSHEITVAIYLPPKKPVIDYGDRLRPECPDY